MAKIQHEDNKTTINVSEKLDSININIVLPKTISAREIKDIITESLLAVDNVREQKIEQLREEETKKWHEAIGYKDYSELKGVRKYLLSFLNFFVTLFKMLFVSKKDIEGTRTTFILLRVILSFCVGLISAIFYFGALGFIFQFVIVVIKAILADVACFNMQHGLLVGYSFLCFMFARLIRIAKIEIQKIKDSNFLFGVFAAVTSVIALIIALAKEG